MKLADLELQFETIFTSAYPSFIYIQDLSGADVAREAINSVLDSGFSGDYEIEIEEPAFAFVDCVSCFSQRLLFDTVLNTLLNHLLTGESVDMVRNDSMDDFLHNLRALFRDSSSTRQPNVVFVFEHAEKLREMNPRLVHPLSRLKELVRRTFPLFRSRMRLKPASGCTQCGDCLHINYRVGEHRDHCRSAP